jgi:cbb3-type cytochrome oxidase maturation protein
MSVIFLLIPLSIVLAACFLGAFIWAVRSGQYEDTCTPSMRVLLEDAGSARAPRAANRALAVGSEAREVRTRSDLITRSDVFREGAEHDTRGACLPKPIPEP